MTSPNVVATGLGNPELSLEAAFRDHAQTATDERLRKAVSGYVYAMKAQGMTAERVIVNLKRIGAQGFVEPTRRSYWSTQPLSRKDDIISDAVSVGIGLYFRPKQYA